VEHRERARELDPDVDEDIRASNGAHDRTRA
jgi:hypothetical protein